VPAPDEGSEADPGSLPDALWPLGDEVATALLGLLEVELRGRGLRWRVVARDRLEVGRTDRPWPGTAVGLAPLRERMLEQPKADWPELIEQYVSDLRNGAVVADADRGIDGPDAAPRGAQDSLWRQVREPLRARILPTDCADAALSAALQRVVTDGLLEAVVTEAPLGRPETGQNGDDGGGDGAAMFAHLRGRDRALGGELVSAGEALGWGVAEHVVFDAARDNVRRDTRMEAERFKIDGTELVALFSPSHYAATHVLWLAEYLAAMPGYVEANGALVVLPHRHLIAVHPIESAAVVAAAGTLLRFAARQFETCPGPISDQLYWWQGGTLNRLPSDSVGETLQLFPSDRFAALLDRLRVGGHPGDGRLPGGD
jgi:hypothetical protein